MLARMRLFSPHTRGWPGIQPCTLRLLQKFSPHTRGWPEHLPATLDQEVGSPRTRGDGPALPPPPPRGALVLPAHAGMARAPARPRDWPGRSPRTRGDGPSSKKPPPQSAKFSPHTRGWPEGQRIRWQRHRVLPAHAGMARSAPAALTTLATFSPHTRGWPGGAAGPWRDLRGSPRTRGDGPVSARVPLLVIGVLPAHAGMARATELTTHAASQFSPHTRGWPEIAAPDPGKISVLPAHAGMARAAGADQGPPIRSPRTRGDGPTDGRNGENRRRRSPRTRGDGPHFIKMYLPDTSVLPAHAGMARKNRVNRFRFLRSPRTRGDGPDEESENYSPDPVLPAHAGMARQTIRRSPGWSTFSPHTRGWPAQPRVRRPGGGSSPRTRGDGPDLVGLAFSTETVLPAHAGMARACVKWNAGAVAFSPHTRGWPVGACLRPDLGAVLPAQRGWPDTGRLAVTGMTGSPRTRGDGPVSACGKR